MIDLVLYAADKATLRTWGETNPAGRPLIESIDDGEGGTIKQARPGLEWSWWAGSGQFMTDAGSQTDPETDPGYVAPTYAPGVVLLMRVHGEFFDWDRLEETPADPDDVKEWERSKIAQYVRNNGTPGTMGGIPYYEVDGVRLFRRKDVDTFTSANNLPGHVFL